MKMKTGTIVLIAVIAVVALVALFAIGSYNGLVGARNEVENKSAQVDTVLQRRLDLIPNLVETVKGYSAHETEVYDKITSARAALAGAQTMEEKATANQQLSVAAKGLTVIAESNPELKANTQYSQLSDELSGTENRINVARQDYNNAVTNYNRKIQTFPSNIFAGMFGFSRAGYFEADANAGTVPTVNFGTTAKAAQ